MYDNTKRGKAGIAANLNETDRDYWLNRLTDNLPGGHFPYDYKNSADAVNVKVVEESFPPSLFTSLMKVKKWTDYTLHVYLLAGAALLLEKYGNGSPIVLGTPIYKQESVGDYVNTRLPLVIQVEGSMTFKALLFQVRHELMAAVEHQNYPVTELTGELGLDPNDSCFPLFRTALLYENIHDRTSFQQSNLDTSISIVREGEYMKAFLAYNPSRYRGGTAEQILRHFFQVLENALANTDSQLDSLEIMTLSEKERLLIEINRTKTRYPEEKTIPQLFEEQVEYTPDHIAVLYEKANAHISYLELNHHANGVARILRANGAHSGHMIGLMLSRSPEMITTMMGILKTGAGYLPLDPSTPSYRISTMLEDSGISMLLTDSQSAERHRFTTLQRLRNRNMTPCLTAPRPQIKDLDNLPVPDRSLVDYEKYNQYIGLAAVKDSVTMQATRGCPYKCAYCHKIWPKSHITRSAEHVFREVQDLYNMGVRRFSLIDDIFNLNVKNSRRFFQLIIDHKMKIQLFFPNGMRGDILTKDYIDLMVEAGTINISLSLETASPRLQKMIGKNLDINRLRENMEYLCVKYPQVILDVQTMHGFPSETEEEALMTLDFLKSLKWLHFPYIHILKIYPNTDMESLALKYGISKEVIDRSADQAYHELADTLPFDKKFTLRYQSEFLNDYFLSKERLLHVLPHQMKVLTADEIVQKYNAYLAEDINSFSDLLKLAGITRDELGDADFPKSDYAVAPQLNQQLKNHFSSHVPNGDAFRILLLDLSTFFSHHVDVFYDMLEPPLGPMYLLTYLNQQLGPRIHGKIVKSRIDFDNYEQLHALLEDFQPQVIGVRTLTYYKDFFHQTISAIRQWGIDVPIIVGGPYATSDYSTLLQDRNIDLVVLGEGEVTFHQLIVKIMDNKGRLPQEQELQEIVGIAYFSQTAAHEGKYKTLNPSNKILMLDLLTELGATQPESNPDHHWNTPFDFAYTIFTSGSTGLPKGTLTSHANVTRVVKNTNYIDLHPGDRLLQLSNYAFDGSVFDIYGALLNGASLVLLAEQELMEIDHMIQSIRRWGISVFFVTTALFNTLVELDVEKLSQVRKILFGGERVSVEHTRKALEYLGAGRLVHMYGPTEATVYATFYNIDHVDPRLGTIPIGRPLSNTTVYVLNDRLEPVPIGVEGELYLGGKGLSAGYLNRVELTSEKFIPHPFSKGERLYRTGDLVRQLCGGELEFLDRKDKQVKLRGFRVELGEIESRLLSHPGVGEAVVLARENESGERNLCAYLVLSGECDIQRLRDYLARFLPAFMIPTHFIAIDKMPLNANGKVDTASLPEPQIVFSNGIDTTGSDQIEDTLKTIWSKILGVNSLQLRGDSDFFELGGHSLKATVLLSRIHQELHVKIPIQEIFKAPTIRGLAQNIRKTGKHPDAFIQPAEEKQYYPLSSAQKRLYIVDQMEKGNLSYNMPTLFVMEGDVDPAKIAGIFQAMVERHESFRTAFQVVNEEPVQRVYPHMKLEPEFEEAPEANVESVFFDFVRPFDLSCAPLLRVKLIKISGKKYILMLDMHHIISDGSSIGVLVREFMALYSGEPLEPLTIQYKDYSQWQAWMRREKAQSLMSQEKYWLELFKGNITALNLPYDYPRPPVQTFTGHSLSFLFTHMETDALNQMASRYNSTLYMLLLAAANVLLARLSGQETISVGTPIAGRRQTELLNIIGMFVNTLPMKNHPDRDKTFSEFLQDVRQQTMDTLENQDYPLEDLVEKVVVRRDPSRNPLFDVMFALHNVEIREILVPGVTLRPYPIEKRIAKFDLNWEGIEAGGQLFFSLEYNDRLFKEDTAKRFIRYFKTIVPAILENPDLAIKEIGILGDEEKQQVLEMSLGVQDAFLPDTTIHKLYEEKAAQNPWGIALVHGNHHLAYNGLNRRANSLSFCLKEQGVGPDHIVGLMVDRSVEMVMAILAIMKAGGAYLPIDSTYPMERKTYMLSNSNVRFLLVNRSIENDNINKNNEGGGIEIMDIRESRYSHQDHHNPSPICTGNNLTYVLYTSGSTGKPKGVMLEHRNLVNLLLWQFNHTGIDCSRVLQFSTICFDASFHEIFSALLSGGTIYIVDEQDRTDIPALFEIIEKNDVKTVFFPISFLKTVFNQEEYAAAFPASVSHIQSAGEQVVISPRFREHLIARKVCLHNHYGPAETHVVTALTLTPNEEIPGYPGIGKPILNTSIHILDKSGRLQPAGIPGEMFIGGNQVGRGYLNKPELTAERFVLLKQHRWEHAYRTGDLGSWLPDGNIKFLGRSDHQVKIRGFRVEPGEIESCLRNCPHVKEAVVIDRLTQNNELYLCAYVVILSGEDVNIPGLRRLLALTLPDYMIPAHFVQINSIPLNPNGKIERSALPEPVLGASAKCILPPADDMERQIVDIWADVLDLDKKDISVTANFFELGGHSLKATILNLKVQKLFHVHLTLSEIFKTQDLRQLSNYIKGKVKKRFVPLEPVEEREYYELSPAQKRLYFLHQVDVHSRAYNLSHIFLLTGIIEIERFQDVMAQLIARHETLRTAFDLVDGRPVQKIHQAVVFNILEYSADESEISRICAEFLRPFDLTRAPLMRLGLIRLGQHRHILMFDMHHIISDGISMKILVREFMEVYSRQILPPLNIQYKDFSGWQNSPIIRKEIKAMETFWLEQFTPDAPLLNLPLDFPRPEVHSYKGDIFHFQLDKPKTDVLRTLCGTEAATLFMMLLALCNILFSKLSGQEDITIGTVAAGRNHADLENTLGIFVNTIALRNYPSRDKTFRQFLNHLKTRHLQVIENQDYPFEDLVEKVVKKRAMGRNPLFDVAFGLQDIHIPGLKIPGLTLEPYGVNSGISKFDMTWYGSDNGDRLNFSIEYRKELFKPETIERFSNYFKEMAAAVAKNPDICLKDIVLSHDLYDHELDMTLRDDNDFGF